jgi:hypothetical protein
VPRTSRGQGRQSDSLDNRGNARLSAVGRGADRLLNFDVRPRVVTSQA